MIQNEIPNIGELTVFEAAYCDDTCNCVYLILGIVTKHHRAGSFSAEPIETSDWLGSDDNPDYRTSDKYRREWKRLHRIKGIMERRGIYNLARSESRLSRA